MIIGQVVRQVPLDTLPHHHGKYWLFDKASVIVHFVPYNQIVVYKLRTDNTYSHFRVYNPIWGTRLFLSCRFLLSKKKQKLFCRVIQANKQLLVFIIHINNQEIEKILEIKVNGLSKFSAYQFESKFYQLTSGNLQVISYKEFPHIDVQTKFVNVKKFDLIEFQNIQLIKIVSDNQVQYYKLPLTTLTKVRYNDKQRNTFFLSSKRIPSADQPNIIIDKVKSYFYRHHARLGIFHIEQLKNHQYYDNSINLYRDKEENLNLFQTKPRQKILRKFKGVRWHLLFKLDGLRYVILQKKDPTSNTNFYEICDLIRATMHVFTQAYNLHIQDNIILEIKSFHSDRPALIHEFKVQSDSVTKIRKLKLKQIE